MFSRAWQQCISGGVVLGPEFYERFKIQILTVNFNTWHNLTIWKVERQIGYYLLYGLLPSMICVVMSWAGFWIKLSVPPARVGLCITTYLSLKTLGQVRFRAFTGTNHRYNTRYASIKTVENLKVIYKRYSKSSIYKNYWYLDVCMWKLSFYDTHGIHHSSGTVSYCRDLQR